MHRALRDLLEQNGCLWAARKGPAALFGEKACFYMGNRVCCERGWPTSMVLVTSVPQILLSGTAIEV